MKTNVEINVLTENEVEEIVIQTHFLLQNGWKKADYDTFNNDSELKELGTYYLLSPISEERKWIKNNTNQYVFLEKIYGDGASYSVETKYFSREEAYEYEMNKKSQPDNL